METYGILFISIWIHQNKRTTYKNLITQHGLTLGEAEKIKADFVSANSDLKCRLSCRYQPDAIEL